MKIPDGEMRAWFATGEDERMFGGYVRIPYRQTVDIDAEMVAIRRMFESALRCARSNDNAINRPTGAERA